MEGHRSTTRQKKLFDAGKSKIDGINRLGKHNHNPSLALDIASYVNGRISWDISTLFYLGGIFRSVATRLLEEGAILHALRWGGNWDGDGEIITDQRFVDLPHFELQATG